jgi:hypothetical protein
MYYSVYIYIVKVIRKCRNQVILMFNYKLGAAGNNNQQVSYFSVFIVN